MNLLNPVNLFLMLLVISISACGTVKNSDNSEILLEKTTMPNNILDDMSANKSAVLSWINAPDQMELHDGILSVTSNPKTDFFIDPENGKSTASAPFLFKEIEGDFVATALVEPDLTGKWNAGSIMVILDSNNWIKFAFENSDATGNSIVTVVTREVSDDANGVQLNDMRRVWLKLIRKGDMFSMLWSEDGESYFMARLAKMPSKKIVKVGLEAQSPLETEATHKFHYFSIEKKTVENLRTGL